MVSYVSYQFYDQNVSGFSSTGGDGIENDSELQFIIGPWSTRCLVVNNYLYNCHSTHGNKTYWR